MYGNDDSLSTFCTAFDNPALKVWNRMNRDLNSQIATGNHDSVNFVQDLFEVVHPLLVLDLGDDLDLVLFRSQKFLELQDV